MTVFDFVPDDSPERVLEYARKNPGFSSVECSRTLGIKFSRVTAYLSFWIKCGVVTRSRDESYRGNGRKWRYSLAADNRSGEVQ